MVLSSQTIKELRDKSGAGMLDCKKALEESEGNVEKAIEWLRKKGINTANKKASRDASDGLITAKIKDGMAVMLEINAETDFVAKNEVFTDFCENLSLTCLSNDVQDINSLSNLNFMGTDKKVSDTLTDLIAKLGENIVIKKFIKLSDKTQKVQKYLHNSVNENSGKIGVLLSYECDELNDKVTDFSKNLCMQIAATNPKSVDRKNLDPELVEKEEVIFREQLNNSGKPDEIINKIVEGKINKFYEEVCLDEQIFVMDGKIKINKLISNFNDENSFNFRIINFYIFKLGQE
ncbi:MAG: elongation factor Ts [Rickettsiales bacterium]|nr:elongation factor Ts [Rickettsiales bacterium]OUT44892.1 MAG: translation elongation factor Ts [Pelagibacteraceae bacterium TMED13]|tara:strand:- start:27640 stop:28512 length:873 start_codon:yes stop_codon:yes gene_type:complete